MGDVGERALRKVFRRLVPFLGLMYLLALVDRINIAFAADQLTGRLGFSATQYGLAAGIFFAGFILFEIPSNLMLDRAGARRWLARIMVTWGLVAAAMALVRSPEAMYVLRFLLGVAEAGFLPGVIVYLTRWVPEAHRTKAIAGFYLALPASLLLAGPLSFALLELDGVAGLDGYQWLFLGQGLPAAVVGVWAVRRLDDTPADARWLDDDEREWLLRELARDAARIPDARERLGPALRDARVLRLGLLAFALTLAGYGVVFFVLDILDKLDVEDSLLPLIAGAPFGFAAAGILLLARAARGRHDLRPLMAASATIGGAGVILSGLLPAWGAIPAIAMAAFGLFGATPIFWTLPGRFLAGVGAAGGVALISTFAAVGAFAGPVVVGIVKDATGQPEPALVVLGAIALATGPWIRRARFT